MTKQSSSLMSQLLVHPLTMIFTLLNLRLVIGLGYLVIKFLISGINYFNSQGKSTPEKQLIRRSLGRTLKGYRMANNMTQEFVAEQLGVSRQAVSKWENGSSDPSTANLLALARLYNVSPQQLLEHIKV